MLKSTSLVGLGLFCAIAAPAWSVPLPITITSSPGYLITWDGNDGAFYNQPVPDNLALASNGATAISSGELGPEFSIDYHLTPNLNDGVYGNTRSWIGGTGDGGPWFAGVQLGGTSNITSIAFGRDNGDPGTEATQYMDRFAGTYTLQITINGVSWVDIGTITLSPSHLDDILGEQYTGYFRHQFAISTDAAAPIVASGVRILVPGTGVGSGTAIDELEVYGPSAIPEPSSAAALAALAGISWVVLRRRR